ncbi:hypothetical protein AB0B56_07375 [Streptosporangium canum]|uniref:hypothetical protein n=1 Tax=Streptosporangium canum TaxID=324952 RepID=UPI0034268176
MKNYPPQFKKDAVARAVQDAQPLVQLRRGCGGREDLQRLVQHGLLGPTGGQAQGRGHRHRGAMRQAAGQSIQPIRAGPPRIWV